MNAQRVRFPMFFKILGACLVLAALLLVSSYYYTAYRAAEARGTTDFLARNMKRYLGFQANAAKALATAAELFAADAALREALASPTPAEPGAARARALLGAITGKSSFAPDVLVVFDANARPIFVSPGAPIRGDELRELEAVTKVRTGAAYFNTPVFHGGRALMASGVPILAPAGDATLGGVLVGAYVGRYFQDYSIQSDDRPVRRHMLALVRDGEVVASNFPQEKLAEVADALKPEKRVKVTDGGRTVEVLSFDDAKWDFAFIPLPGFVGPTSGTIGQLYLMRNRAATAAFRGQRSQLTDYLLGTSLAVVVAVLLALWVTRPIKRIIRATQAIASGEGDLTKRIDVRSSDEMGVLAENVNRIFDNLQRLVLDVQGAAFQVGASSAEISAASKQMLDGAKDQAVKVESSTAAVTELSASIQQVASNAMEATKVAQQSNESVTSAIDSMAQIRRAVEEAAEKIHELGESGKRIGNIVEVIRQISEQTSLLALNASIEAAHAGEQGRGFAVVADEVSSLARRVGQSAKDIEDLIATLKDQTADAVRTMQAGTQAVEGGTGQVSTTLSNLKQIIEVVQDTAHAVQEQAIVSDEIAHNMDAVHKIANEVLGSSEEAVIQGEQLHSLADALEQSVRGFKAVGDGTTALPAPAGAATSARALPSPRRAEDRPPARAAALGGRPTGGDAGRRGAAPRSQG